MKISCSFFFLLESKEFWQLKKVQATKNFLLLFGQLPQTQNRKRKQLLKMYSKHLNLGALSSDMLLYANTAKLNEMLDDV